MRTLSRTWLLPIVGLLVLAVEARGAEPQTASSRAKAPWRGVHIMAPGSDGLPLLKRAIREAMAPLGVNTLLLEVDYNFRFPSHPELSSSHGLTPENARDLAEFCRARGIRLIPLFNCLGHQSWSSHTHPLLTLHPTFDESPNAPADNKGLYCRSWCPLHPRVNKIAFALMDDLIDAFQADALHVGMDEVFVIASDQCPRCRGKDPAQLFAKAVNDYHRHLVGEKKVEMLMWGDRLLDNTTMKYGKWESSANGTAGAIELVPKDIIICDWHYEPGTAYPSVPYFQEKGFRVWPSSWRNKEAALALLKYSRAHAIDDRLVGHLCTTWTDSGSICRTLLGEEKATTKRGEGPRAIVDAFRACMAELKPEGAARGGP